MCGVATSEGGAEGRTSPERQIIEVITAKMVAKMSKMGVIREHQLSRDFWRRQNCGPTRAPITHAMPLNNITNAAIPHFIAGRR